ncbi:MAG: Fe-S protein assembly co-chaperone HscB [Rhodoferax sp.]|nr:Fe-S protein assembly co-chaperone HscB [Rhodoferax sp.]
MNLQSNDFELFGLAQQFAQERTVLDARWKDLQRQAHPDKFVTQGAAAQRLALQWSVRINEAYQRLKDPLKRAAYLCELGGVSVNAQGNTGMPMEFLLQQMQWREALDAAPSPEVLEALRGEVDAAQHQLLQACADQLDVQHDYAAAAQTVCALMFIDKFSQNLSHVATNF